MNQFLSQISKAHGIDLPKTSDQQREPITLTFDDTMRVRFFEEHEYIWLQADIVKLPDEQPQQRDLMIALLSAALSVVKKSREIIFLNRDQEELLGLRARLSKSECDQNSFETRLQDFLNILEYYQSISKHTIG